jgi:hypothetical protein
MAAVLALRAPNKRGIGFGVAVDSAPDELVVLPLPVVH